MAKHIEWFASKTPPNDNQIRLIEGELDINFPDDFINCIKENNGGFPVQDRVNVNGSKEVLNNLLSFNPEDISILYRPTTILMTDYPNAFFRLLETHLVTFFALIIVMKNQP